MPYSRKTNLAPDVADKAIEELMADSAPAPRLQFRLLNLFKLIAAVGVLCAFWRMASAMAPEVYAGAFMLLLATASVLAVLRIR